MVMIIMIIRVIMIKNITKNNDNNISNNHEVPRKIYIYWHKQTKQEQQNDNYRIIL